MFYNILLSVWIIIEKFVLRKKIIKLYLYTLYINTLYISLYTWITVDDSLPTLLPLQIRFDYKQSREDKKKKRVCVDTGFSESHGF